MSRVPKVITASAHLEEAPDWRQEADVGVGLRRLAVQAVARRDELLTFEEALLCLQDGEDALVLRLVIPDSQTPWCSASAAAQSVCADM